VAYGTFMIGATVPRAKQKSKQGVGASTPYAKDKKNHPAAAPA